MRSQKNWVGRRRGYPFANHPIFFAEMLFPLRNFAGRNVNEAADWEIRAFNLKFPRKEENERKKVVQTLNEAVPMFACQYSISSAQSLLWQVAFSFVVCWPKKISLFLPFLFGPPPGIGRGNNNNGFPIFFGCHCSLYFPVFQITVIFFPPFWSHDNFLCLGGREMWASSSSSSSPLGSTISRRGFAKKKLQWFFSLSFHGEAYMYCM